MHSCSRAVKGKSVRGAGSPADRHHNLQAGYRDSALSATKGKYWCVTEEEKIYCRDRCEIEATEGDGTTSF